MATTTANRATVEPRQPSDAPSGCFPFLLRIVAEAVVAAQRRGPGDRADTDAAHRAGHR